MPGRATTYTIVVTNLGPSPVTAASVTDLFPVALVAPAWTCTADPGSSCAAASGTGNLATTVTLEAGDRATFTVTGLIAANATGLLVNTATVTAPAGAVDGDTTNNTATSSVTLTPSADLQHHQGGPRSTPWPGPMSSTRSPSRMRGRRMPPASRSPTRRPPA